MAKSTPLKIGIVGAGISSLATAFFIEKFARLENILVEIDIFEEASKAGGKIYSEKCGNFLVEHGADSISTRQAAVYEIISELGLLSETIAPKERRFAILKDGKMQQVALSLLAPFPKNLQGLFSSKLVSFGGKLRACYGGALVYLGIDKLFASNSDQSLQAYFRKKWGKEVSEALLEPLFSGLYGGDLGKISSRVLQLSSVKSRHNLPPYIGFKNGIFSLIEALRANLKNTKFNFLETVQSISKIENELFLKTEKGERRIQVCIITTPAHAAAKILLEAAPNAAKLLANFQASDAAIVSLGFAKYEANLDLLQTAGSGIIIPAGESNKIRGITLSSKKWENRSPQDQLLVRVFGREGVFESLKKEEAIELARAELLRILNLGGEVIYSDLHIWKRGSALCSVGHHEKLAQLKSELNVIPGAFMVGAPYGGVGIGDCIESAKSLAQELLKTSRV